MGAGVNAPRPVEQVKTKMSRPPVTEIVSAETDGAVERSAALLRGGGLVAFPTETVYGLGADATDRAAVLRLYAAKGRPGHNPLIAHCDTPEAAFRHGRPDAAAQALAQAFWPGPLTLVVPASEKCAVVAEARAGRDTVALRCPSHPVARALLSAVGRPVAAPSANRSGHVSPTEARHVLDDLDGRIDLVIDGGASAIGLESTVVACLPDGMRLLRPGFILPDTLRDVTGQPLTAAPDEADTPLSPGQLASHYAPGLPVRLDVEMIGAGDAFIGFGTTQVAGADKAAFATDLSPAGDLTEAASRLYATLRAADRSGAVSIAVAPIPRTGLGLAINDRLARAAAPSGKTPQDSATA